MNAPNDNTAAKGLWARLRGWWLSPLARVCWTR